MDLEGHFSGHCSSGWWVGCWWLDVQTEWVFGWSGMMFSVAVRDWLLDWLTGWLTGLSGLLGIALADRGGEKVGL